MHVVQGGDLSIVDGRLATWLAWSLADAEYRSARARAAAARKAAKAAKAAI